MSDHEQLPVRVSGDIGHAVSVSANGSHTCAINTDAELYCWGGNYTQETGAPKERNFGHEPVKVDVGGEKVKQVSVRLHGTCGTTVAGKVFCLGQLPQLHGDLREEYRFIKEWDNSIQRVVLTDDSVCALNNGGLAECAGDDAASGSDTFDGTDKIVPVKQFH